MLYRVVRDHFETFRAEAAGMRNGEGLPRFVGQEFRDFLGCGWRAGGFAGFAARSAASIGSWRSHVKDAGSVPVAAGAAWPSGPRIWWTMCSLTCP